jgi:hypothetical protein
VLRIRHDDARDIDVQGPDGSAPGQIVTFDDPHRAAGTILDGEYPSGVIRWGAGQWQINVPHGAFGTFNLGFADRQAASADFRFYAPRIFVGIDAYNGGTSAATLTIHCPEMREQTFTIKAGELRRIRTGWGDRSSRVFFDVKGGEGLQFDNLVYRAD